MTICHDPEEAVSDAILAIAGGDAAITTVISRPWASATFVGRKLRMTLRLEGEDSGERASALASRLPRHDFDIAGQIVADVQIDEQYRGTRADGSAFAALVMTVLMVEDR